MDGLPQFNIPDKLYFRIGEVSKICDLPTHVLRFWEKEFSQIRPKRTDAGQRLYRQKDVQTVLTVKHLLHTKRFTIEGARQYLKNAPQAENLPEKDGPLAGEAVREIRRELENIKSLLSKKE